MIAMLERSFHYGCHHQSYVWLVVHLGCCVLRESGKMPSKEATNDTARGTWLLLQWMGMLLMSLVVVVPWKIEIERKRENANGDMLVRDNIVT